MVRAEDAENHPQRHIFIAALGAGIEVAVESAEKEWLCKNPTIFFSVPTACGEWLAIKSWKRPWTETARLGAAPSW